MRKQYYFRRSPGGYAAWDVDRLVALAARLPRATVPLADLEELDHPYGIEGVPGTLTYRELAEHARLVSAANLRYPIILSAAGRIMDGRHRVMKALNAGHATIEAVRFARDPEPDFVDVQPETLPYIDEPGVAPDPPVAVTLEPIEPSDRPALRNLLQFYEYDFSEVDPRPVAADGCFHQLDDVQFDHGYFIRADAALAGFVLVSRQASKTGPGEVWWMDEFFVLRAYRHHGVGRRAASLALGRHPGAWEVTQSATNTAAVEFWRRVLAPYGFEDVAYDDPTWGRRSLQRFVVPEPGSA